MFKKFWNTPWTWGTYIKLCIASMLICIGYMALLFKAWDLW